MQKSYRKPKQSRLTARRSKGLEHLESRQLMAAHIVGDPTVYATIQAAVDAAAPRAIVNVDAGSYSEQVYIGKTITIRGVQAGMDARSNVRNGAVETIMNGMVMTDGTHTSSFYIAANDVTIDGFTVQGNTTVGPTGAGMVIAPSMHGTHVINNIVQNNVAGLFLANNSATDPAIIRFNIFRNNNNAGSDGGRGIYTDGGISGGNLTNVLIDSNAFLNNYGSTGTTTLEAAIALESRTLNSQHYITVTNNSFDGDGKGVLMYNADHIDIENNEVTYLKDQWSGVFRCEGGGSYVNVIGNTVYSSTGPAVRVDEKGFAGPNFNWVVTGNNFYNNSTAYTNKQSVVLSALNQYDGTFIVTNNYWGSASGPSGDGTGIGDNLTLMGNSAIYSPWATSMIGTGRMPYYGAALSTDAVMQMEDYDQGGEGVAYHDLDTGNAGGQYRKGPTAVDIGTTTDAGGGYIVESVKAGEWLKYTINASQAGTYTIGFRVAAGVGGGTFHLMIDGINVTGTMTVPTTGTNTFTTLTKTGVALTAGQHDVQLVFDGNSAGGTVGNFNWMQFTNTTPPAVPLSPNSLDGLAATFSTVSLNWHDNSANETGFVIERRALPYGNWTSVTTVAANVTSFTDTTATAGTTYSYRIRSINAAGQSGNSNEFNVATPPQQDTTYVSDLPMASSTNGWGPVERDQSVGSSNANDGSVITLNGATYAKGLGTNAISDVTYTLGGAYGTFISDIGIDDKQLYDGSAVFQIFADGTKVYDSGIMTPDSATQTINLSIVGVQTLELHVDDAGDGPDFDQADWAGARLLLAPPAVVPTVPNTPTGLSAAGVSSGQINLSWADDIGETGYEIQRSIDNTDFTQIAIASANSTNYNDAAGLLPNTQYYYRIVATNAAGDSGYSAEVNATTFAAPQPAVAPSGLAASAASSTQINLTWTDNSSDELNFILERSTDGVSFTQIATPAANATSYVDSTGVLASTTYTYRLRAVNAAGPSINSNITTATTPAAPTVPTGPTNLVAAAVSQTQINLTWTDNSGNETGFVIERSLDGVTFTQIATPAANVTTYSDTTGLIAGTSYSYRVSAINAVGTSTVSNVAVGTTIAAPTAPLAPSGLAASAASSTQINLTWADNSSNETGFVIERSTDNVTFTQIATPTINATSYSDATGLVAGTKFYYRVRAMNAVGASANSNIASVTTIAAPTAPVAPSGLAASAASSTQINLSWTDNSTNETGFAIERSTDNVTFTQIATPAANATSYGDANGLNAGTLYYYRIHAINAVGSSLNSNIASAATLAPIVTSPTAPSNLVAAAVSTSQINLTWTDNASNELNFVIERSTDNVAFTQIATPTANATSYSDATGLSAGTLYYYRVRAGNSGGASANSNVASATTIAAPTAPLAPSNLVASAMSQTQINLSWSDNSGNETGFIVERSTDNVTFTQIAAPAANATSYSDATGLSASTKFYYRVRATNAVGPSANSNVANAATLAPIVTIPSAPTNLIATANSTSQITLSWTDNANNETNFILERSTDNVTFAQIASPAANATSMTDGSLNAGTVYYYRVRAGNSAGASANSNIASATTLVTPTAPSAPGNLVATAMSQSQISLSWSDNSTNETGFVIERSTDNATFSQIAAPTANATSYSDATGLNAGTQYFYRVSAINAVGSSGVSNIATATTIAAPQLPVAPSGLAASAASSSQINLTWTDNSTNETGFVIERSTDNATFSQIATPAANATSYSDSTGLLASTQYFYRIHAINGVGSSVNSNVASATTAPSVVLNLPAAPSNLVATVVSPTSIKLTWTDNSNNETNFILERSSDGVTWAQLATPPANAISTTDGASLTAGKTLYYRVRAGNNDGASANSNVATVTIPTVQLPSAPSSLVATAASVSQINLTWTDNANNETGFIVERSTDGVTFTQIAAPAANATSYVDAAGLSSGTKYFYRVRAINAAGASANSPIATATTLVSTALPTGWTDSDLGSTGKPGNATYTAGVYTLNGAGTGIGKNADALNFAGTTMSGNGTLTVRVASNTGTAGITMRDGSAINAKSVSLTVASDGTLTFNTRSSVGGNVATTSLGKITGAVYLRLQRISGYVVAYTSTNGTKWTLAAYTSISMSTSLNVGMIATSKSTTTLATAKFDNVALVLG